MFVAIVAASVGIILFIAAVMFIAVSRHKKRCSGENPAVSSRSPSSPDNGDTAVTAGKEQPDYNGMMEEYLDPDIRIQDVSTLDAPHPIRPPNSTDSAVIDLLRNTAEIPGAIMEIARAVNDADTHMKKLAELISTDPVLSTRILRVANSPAIGSGKVTSINTAIMLLGLNQVSIMVHQMLASNAIKSAFDIPKDELVRLWKHSAAVSCFTRSIVMSISPSEPGLLAPVQTCALLHDIGKFYLSGLKPQSEIDVNPDDLTCLLSENDIYGTDHCHLGYMLAEFWSLPEIMALSIGFHHHVSFSNFDGVPSQVRRIVAVIAIGDYMAHITGYSPSGIACGIPEEKTLSLAGINRPLASFFTKKLMQEIRYTEMLIDEAENAS